MAGSENVLFAARCDGQGYSCMWPRPLPLGLIPARKRIHSAWLGARRQVATRTSAGRTSKAAILVGTDLTGADLTGCHIHGVSAWRLKLEGANHEYPSPERLIASLGE